MLSPDPLVAWAFVCLSPSVHVVHLGLSLVLTQGCFSCIPSSLSYFLCLTVGPSCCWDHLHCPPVRPTPRPHHVFPLWNCRSLQRNQRLSPLSLSEVLMTFAPLRHLQRLLVLWSLLVWVNKRDGIEGRKTGALRTGGKIRAGRKTKDVTTIAPSAWFLTSTEPIFSY